MKRIVFIGLAIFGLLMASTTEIYAQRYDRESHGRKIGHYDKKYQDRDNYYKDLRKAEQKYYKDRVKAKKKYQKNLAKHQVPGWAKSHNYKGDRHVYFTDYKAYYDYNRAGYVYHSGTRWVFSPSVPKFMLNVDLGKAKIQIMNQLPIGVGQRVVYRR